MLDAVIYPGSFDPITNGHLDVILRATRLCKRVVVVVAANQEKHPLFDLEQRVRLVKESIAQAPILEDRTVEVYGLSNRLLVDFASELGIFTILKGLRNCTNFEYELPQAWANRMLNPKIETIFLTSTERYSCLSSTVVRAIARYHGDVSSLVPPPVQEALSTLF